MRATLKGGWSSRVPSPDGYIPVDNMELDIKEMMEMGKRANTSRQHSGSNTLEVDGASGDRR